MGVCSPLPPQTEGKRGQTGFLVFVLFPFEPVAFLVLESKRKQNPKHITTATTKSATECSFILFFRIHFSHFGPTMDSTSSSNAPTTSSVQQEAFTTTKSLLEQKPTKFMAPITSVVGLRDVVTDPPMEDEAVATSLLTPNRGHHALFRALEEIEGLEKQEGELMLHTELTTDLTGLVTGDTFPGPRVAIQTLEALCRSVPRRVCQHPFKRNDIVWVCRTCQADETCVLCHNCYKNSDHEGHDVAFYHAQAGGCCDCGDPDAWDPQGFCPMHGPAANTANSVLSDDIIERVRGVVPATVDWMVQRVAKASEDGHLRAHVGSSSSGDTNNTSSSPMSDQTVPHPDTTPGSTDSFTASVGGSTESTVPGFSNAEQLGMLALQGGGLYLVLRSDDIHVTAQWVDALRKLLGTSSLYTDSILQKLVRALRQYGQLVVWGTMELLAEINPTQVQLWLDGDRVAAGNIGKAMISRAQMLTSNGLFCSIMTLEELRMEQRAVAVLQWLTSLARSCDPLCQTVAESIAPDRHLVPLLRADFKLSSRVTKYWHSLLLTLLAVPKFKSHLAAAYCDTYKEVTSEYARGMGVLERSGYALSVQFLNRVTYVVDLVQGRDLLGKLGASLLETLRVAALPSRTLNPNHFVLTHRRYSPCISDLKCVLNVKGMPRLFANLGNTFLQDWISALALGQMMDPQLWRDWSEGHIEMEVRGWVGAFNASISLGSLFERLLSWDDDDPSPIKDPNSPLSKDLLSCVELTLHVLVAGVAPWQESEMTTFQATPYTASLEPYKRRPASLPFSTVAAKHGSVLAFRALPMSQKTPFSFHLPLHRFVAACLREVGLRPTGMNALLEKLSGRVSDPHSLFLGLMEFPLFVLSRAAQVRAGLWKRNGNGLSDQVLNYAEPPFCRAMRDADLLLVQFAMLGRTHNQTTDLRPDSDVGVCFLVHLLLHRLGIFDFCGLAKAPNADINRYLDEVQQGLYSPEQNAAEDAMSEDFLLPWTYTPARDAASSLLLLEEFLHTMITLCCELPPLPPEDKSAHTAQAKWRLRREVIHRLASGPKTHSELAEVHHVLSHWDNVYLSEEGKLVNPDDATGAALGSVLAEVATRRVSRGKMEPDKWELSNSAWESYDPNFFHISLRSHQTAAESRPAPKTMKSSPDGVAPKAFCPSLTPAHPTFERLRRDITSDATMLVVAYRTLHIHCRDTKNKKDDVADLRGSMAYESDERSEIALARAVHLLTIGAFAWQRAHADDKDWRNGGGGSVGSVFFDRSDDAPAPTAKEWVSAAMLANPKTLLACDWYAGEENCLQLLRRLAVDGGTAGNFLAQDKAVRSGAAWLCEFAATHNTEASKIVGTKQSNEGENSKGEKQETEIEKRKRMAKERAMERMKAQAAKFAMTLNEADMGDDDKEASDKEGATRSSTPQRPTRQGSMGSARSCASSVASTSDSDRASTPFMSPEAQSMFDETMIPSRLLCSRPQCIICSDDGTSEIRSRDYEEEGHRKSRRRRTDGGNALAFVGYTQASTVLKGGGGPPSGGSFYTSSAPVRRFVGAHVALCGHAVHSECWESYLATVSHREDRIIGKRDEFRCPLCQRLSNCLVPFIDVGSDWIDSATCLPVSGKNDSSLPKLDDGADSMSCEIPESCGPLSLQNFLASTPWWVPRHNTSVVWDGQCAFVASSTREDNNDKSAQLSSVSKVPRRRSVRPLRKKDLYAAWNAMMKTPRFVRRKLRPRSDGNADETMAPADGPDVPGNHFAVSLESAGETVVWRRFMDQVSDITYRADGKRLGDENLHNDFGEFRHYIVEKYAYNMANRFAGKEPSDWPSCVFPSPLSDMQRQELSREKLLSKLMMTVQAFTYSCCSEAYEARRLVRKAMASSAKVAGIPDENNLGLIFSKFGIAEIVCDGKLIVMPRPSSLEDDGTQPFHGRLGRLRYFGLAVMAAAGAVAADLVQLVLPFPLGSSSANASVSHGFEKPYRAPIVYPILYGHVLTHVVAAICASSGRARARSDSLELVWPVPFSSRGSFVASDGSSLRKNVDSVVEDSEGFVKLGLLARILQVLLAKIDLQGLDNIPVLETELLVVKTLRRLKQSAEIKADTSEGKWTSACINLLEIALANHTDFMQVPEQQHVEAAIADRLREGCSLAADAACMYLADVGTLLQVILPGVMARYDNLSTRTSTGSAQGDSLATFEKLWDVFRFEPLSMMLSSPLIRDVVSNWYEDARRHAKAAVLPGDAISGSGAAVCSRLFRTQGFRAFDWPMDDYSHTLQSALGKRKGGEGRSNRPEPQDETAIPMEIDTIQPAGIQTTTTELQHQSTLSLVTFSAKKSVQLIGGYASELTTKNNGRPRVAVIPTSYTDLYAELGQLLPDSEQTAVCLICGEVLNAGGKSECTRHSYKCGAGTGMFFLLQECAGLIMHNGKAAYIHSPYVDSHGETPQYRGRPLNLDLARYDHLHEVWSGHAVRQQVLAERGSSRQVIVPDFY